MRKFETDLYLKYFLSEEHYDGCSYYDYYKSVRDMEFRLIEKFVDYICSNPVEGSIRHIIDHERVLFEQYEYLSQIIDKYKVKDKRIYYLHHRLFYYYTVSNKDDSIKTLIDDRFLYIDFDFSQHSSFYRLMTEKYFEALYKKRFSFICRKIKETKPDMEMMICKEDFTVWLKFPLEEFFMCKTLSGDIYRG